MKNKKAQIESGELIMVIIIVMVLLIVGIVVYGSVRDNSSDQKQSELTSIRAIDLAIQAVTSSELKCNFAVETGELCIDFYRMQALREILIDGDADTINYFRSKFGPATITVYQVYPTPGSWEIYDARLQGTDTEIPLRVPVKIYDAFERTFSFGYMEVIKYG